MKTLTISFVHHIKNHLNDPITALDIYNHKLLIGTIMGNIYYTNIPKQFDITIKENAIENITGVAFVGDDIYNGCIGDCEIIKFNMTDQDTPGRKTQIDIHQDSSFHSDNCESCFTFLCKNSFFQINTKFSTESIKVLKFSYQKRNLASPSIIITGEIEATNYSIPFDFDGDKYIWIENYTPELQRLCVYSTVIQAMELVYSLPKELGHISHMKLLPNNQVFLVRQNNLCEIRTLTNQFPIETSFQHIGYEVIATDVFIIDEVFDKEAIELKDSQRSSNNLQKTVDPKPKLQGEKLVLKDDFKGSNQLEEKAMQKLLYIATLDYDGNFNVFFNGKEETMFNIYNMDIDQDYKDKEFFSLGFPYYIKMNSFYYAIATDHGVFVFQNENNVHK